MSGPWSRPTIDPVTVIGELELADKLDDAFEEGYLANARRWRVVEILLAALSGAVLGAALTAAIVHASAPRSAAEPVIPAVVFDRGGASGNLAQQPTGAPPTLAASPVAVPGTYASGRPPDGSPDPSPAAATPTPPPAETDPPAIAGGLASFVDPSFGSRYLALPEGPGRRVRVCGPAGCVTRSSTDAGPDLAMQRAGRIADLSFVDFKAVCGCDPWLVGTLPVSVEDLGR